MKYQKINDLLRKKYNEEKISEIVVKNIKRLQQEGIKIGIEATYTNYHLQQGFTVWDCINYFNKEFGIASIHIPPISAKKNHSNFSWRIFPEHFELCIKSYTGAIKKCIDSWVKGEEMCSFSFLDRYLEAILKGYKSHLFCPAYVDTIAVWWNGDIYPCFMFWGVEEFKIGNIDFIKPEELKYSLLNKIPTKIEIKKCNECEIKWLCNICLGGVYNESDTIWNIPYYLCEWQKAIIKELIYWLAYTREISDLWDKLIKNLKLKHANF
jgi:radical SAM protein with 4Fe4S-binding SPASM domain